MKKLVVFLLTCCSVLAYAQDYTLILRNYEDKTYLVYIDDKVQYLEPRFGYTILRVPITAKELTVGTNQKKSKPFDLQSLVYQPKQFIEIIDKPNTFEIVKSDKTWNVKFYELEPMLTFIAADKNVQVNSDIQYKNKCEVSSDEFQKYLNEGLKKPSDNDKLGYYKRNLKYKCITMSQLVMICNQLNDDKSKIILYQALENQLLESIKYKDFIECIVSDNSKQDFRNYYFSKGNQ